MTTDTTPHMQRNPLKLLAVSFLLSGAAIAWLLFSSHNESVIDHKRNTQLLLIQELRGKIFYYNDMMSNALQMAALVPNQGWQSAYENYKRQLANSFLKLERIAPHALADTTERVRMASDHVLELEQSALLLMDAGLHPEAAYILFGDEYRNQKEITQKSLNAIDQKLVDLVAQEQEKDEQSWYIRFLTGISVMLAMIILWYISWLILQRWRTAMQQSSQQLENTLQKLEKSKYEADASRAEYKAVIDSAVDGIITLSEEGQILSCNHSAEKLFGLPATSITGQNILNLIPDMRAVTGSALFSMSAYCKMAEAEHHEYIIKLETTGVKPVEVGVSRVKIEGQSDDKPTYTAIIHDIQMQKIAEAAQRETEVVRRKNEAKSAFLATMSHELRTPLNGITGMAEILLRTKLTDEQEDFARTIQKSASLLQGVINDILDFSKIEEGALTLEPIEFDLHQMVDDVADVFTSVADDKQVDLMVRYVPGTPEYVKGDPGRIRQILNNLVNNALKFTPDGHVLVTVEQESAGEIPVFKFSVTDTGIGIPEEKQVKIFERFTQADESTTRRFGGTGLGLAICKQLTDLMEGNIGVDSASGEGSTFWFTLPLPVVKAPADSNQALAEPSSLFGKKILVVEDNLINARIMNDEITYLGADCTIAVSAEKALQILNAAYKAKKMFDIAIIDQLLPGMDGLTFGTQLKKDPKFKDIKIAISTSIARQGDASMYKDASFDGYLTKPLKSHTLKGMLLALVHKEDDSLLTSYTVRARVKNIQKNHEVGQKLKILVAEDDKVNQKVVTSLLKQLGHEVVIAGNGREAVEKYQTQAFDFILMDMRMPEMDGLEATNKIRQLERSSEKRMPIIALTANATNEDRQACMSAGMDDFLSKPITVGKFEEMIAKHTASGSKKVPGKKAEPTATSAEVDFGYLQQVTGGDKALLKELLTYFVEGAEEAIAALKSSKIDENQWRQAAHKFKGSALNLGMTNLANMCAEAESTTNKNSQKKLLASIQQAYAKIKTEIHSILAI